jgi:hypothetical protein
VRKRVLGDVNIASATVEARFIAAEALVEIEAVAVVD